MKHRWRIWVFGLLLIMVAFLVLVTSASAWLETDSGRKLLQREVGKGLGLLATLEGDYELRIFPSVRIAGQDLVLHDPDEVRPLAAMNSYDLHLALWPLMRKRVVIHKVAVNDGSLDLDLLAGLGQDDGAKDSGTLTLPRITALEITGLALVKSSEVLVTIASMNLQDFAANQDSGFSISMMLPNSGSGYGGNLVGVLNVRPVPLEVNLQTEQIHLNVNGEVWPLGAGQLAWFVDSGELTANFHGTLLGFDAKYELAALTQPALQVQLETVLQASGQGPLSAQLQVSDQAGIWQIDAIDLDLDGQQLAGSGCFSTADKPSLRLQLAAAQLDLDALQQLIPANLLGSDEPQADDTDTRSARPSPPIDLAISLQAEQAVLSGAEARDIRLQIGGQPNCSSLPAATEG